MLEFILAQKDGGESFKRNFIIYLVNCFFSGPKSLYYSKSILIYLKDVSQIASLDWLDKLITSVRHYKKSTATKGKANSDLCASSFSPIVPLDKPDGEARIRVDTLVFDANIIVEKQEHHEDVVLDQPKSVTKKDHSMPSNSLGLGLNDGIEDDDNGAPLKFPLGNTSQVSRELSVKKPAEKKPKEGDKKGEVRKQSIKIKKSTLQQQTTGSKVPSPHNAKEPAEWSKQALSLEPERKQPLAKKVDSSLAARHEAGKQTKPPMHGEGVSLCLMVVAIKRPLGLLWSLGEQLEMNVINIWSIILNDREKKRDLATPSRFFMSCDQSVSASHSTYCSIIIALEIITKSLRY
ncbi:hypothetical protein Cgig2_029766 [Carnegiea gigantea]|uniref:Uncharacterized protein n=1 Tax=Carnegiea gigantea TaxID=171969 RepID=A0A9Q1QC25_9CARY|nr:hypothetical protein Cgig2_029766 [Carnegiea gigantea]